MPDRQQPADAPVTEPYDSRETQNFGFLREAFRHHRHDRNRRARIQRILQDNGDDFPDFCIMAFGKRLADED